mmetsp:Transcript_68308/g.216120  ORF Transcript_68308/g.216120 Transcript_68308/m.216120 type:complete len:159 (-) Transcript_68308:375-851(-)
MASSFGAPERPGLMKVMLRLLLALELVVSVGIVIYLIVLETPPETKISFGIVGLCCLMFITATAGLLCATNSRCCIITYVVLALLAAGGELAIAALFHFKKDMAYVKHKRDWRSSVCISFSPLPTPASTAARESPRGHLSHRAAAPLQGGGVCKVQEV